MGIASIVLYLLGHFIWARGESKVELAGAPKPASRPMFLNLGQSREDSKSADSSTTPVDIPFSNEGNLGCAVDLYARFVAICHSFVASLAAVMGVVPSTATMVLQGSGSWQPVLLTFGGACLIMLFEMVVFVRCCDNVVSDAKVSTTKP